MDAPHGSGLARLAKRSDLSAGVPLAVRPLNPPQSLIEQSTHKRRSPAFASLQASARPTGPADTSNRLPRIIPLDVRLGPCGMCAEQAHPSRPRAKPRISGLRHRLVAVPVPRHRLAITIALDHRALPAGLAHRAIGQTSFLSIVREITGVFSPLTLPSPTKG